MVGVEVPQGGDDDVAGDLLPKLLQILLLIVLAGNHHSGDSLGPALSVFHGYLGLAVRAEALDGPQLAGVGECQRQPVGKHHGQGEELERFRTGEAVHDTLVASPHFTGAAHSPGDVSALVMGDGLHLIITGIAGFPHRPADDGGDIRQPPGGNLPGDNDFSRRGHGLAGHMGGGIMLQTGVQNAVGDGVAQLVRVAFGDRLGGQDVLISHESFLFSFFVLWVFQGNQALPTEWQADGDDQTSLCKNEAGNRSGK